jgi:hypothetical protein
VGAGLLGTGANRTHLDFGPLEVSMIANQRRRALLLTLGLVVALAGPAVAQTSPPPTPETVPTPPPMPATVAEAVPPSPGPVYVWIAGQHAWRPHLRPTSGFPATTPFRRRRATTGRPATGRWPRAAGTFGSRATGESGTRRLFLRHRPTQATTSQQCGSMYDRAKVVVKERLEGTSDSVFESASTMSSTRSRTREHA